jgi:hypothetical protein
VAGIADLPSLPEISYDKFNANGKSNDWSHFGGAEGTAPISLKQTEFSLKRFPIRMGQPNFTGFNKWKKVWMSRSLEKKHRSIIPGPGNVKPLRN